MESPLNSTAVDDLLAQSAITKTTEFSDKLRAVLHKIPRLNFVPEEHKDQAYGEELIPLELGQTLLPLPVVAAALAALEINSNDSVLEVGTGNGYTTACLTQLADHVTSIEIYPQLLASAGKQLAMMGIFNAHIHHMSLTDLLADPMHEGQYDVVLVTGSTLTEPAGLRELLRDSGRLFVVTGEPGSAMLIQRTGTDFAETRLFDISLPALEL